jgi:hypothetical protein
VSEMVEQGQREQTKRGPFAWLGELIDDIEAALAPYFLLIVCVITIAGFIALGFKIG